MNKESPSSSAAPLRDSVHDVAPPPDDDEREPLLPDVRIAGVKLTTLALLFIVVVGTLLGLRACIRYSSDEVTRSKTELHEAFGR